MNSPNGGTRQNIEQKCRTSLLQTAFGRSVSRSFSEILKGVRVSDDPLIRETPEYKHDRIKWSLNLRVCCMWELSCFLYIQPISNRNPQLRMTLVLVPHEYNEFAFRRRQNDSNENLSITAVLKNFQQSPPKPCRTGENIMHHSRPYCWWILCDESDYILITKLLPRWRACAAVIYPQKSIHETIKALWM